MPKDLPRGNPDHHDRPQPDSLDPESLDREGLGPQGLEPSPELEAFLADKRAELESRPAPTAQQAERASVEDGGTEAVAVDGERKPEDAQVAGPEERLSPAEGEMDIDVDDPYQVRDLGPEISPQKQARHIRDTDAWRSRGQGSYFESERDAQTVLDSVHDGSAEVLGRTRAGHLLVQCDKVTGYNNNPGSGYMDQPTNVFAIKGVERPSVVPFSPTARPSR